MVNICLIRQKQAFVLTGMSYGEEYKSKLMKGRSKACTSLLIQHTCGGENYNVYKKAYRQHFPLIYPKSDL